MNIQRPEHLDTQYIYRDYGGYIFKLPRNKELGYQSIEIQEYYYWSLAELAYKQLVTVKPVQSVLPIDVSQVAGWQIQPDPIVSTVNTALTVNMEGILPSASRYIQVNEIKKSQRDKLIAESLAKIYTHESVISTTNPFQFIETIS